MDIEEKRKRWEWLVAREDDLRDEAEGLRGEAYDLDREAGALEREADELRRDICAHDYDPIAGEGRGYDIFGHEAFLFEFDEHGRFLTNGHMLIRLGDVEPPTTRGPVENTTSVDDDLSRANGKPHYPWSDKSEVYPDGYRIGGLKFNAKYIDALRWQSTHYCIIGKMLVAYTEDGKIVGAVMSIRE